ncbi:hypothetical protein AX15_004343 [Amanita polypyramis BW_CC]|nr:hypothetical protein AX15_004343 [Amanita polypyramis BW_CC]
MCIGSPTAYILWSILSIIFMIVLLTHLWIYDRFQCVKWNSGRQPGAFKRLMTYSYLGSIPLLVVYSVGMTRVKVKEGFSPGIGGEMTPTGCVQWEKSTRDWLLPLYFCLSGGWALEIVTHLEELTFWLFLLHQGPSQRPWFRSWEFRMWYIGSALAVIGLPLTTLLARTDLGTTQAWILLVGSSASTCTTICFFYVLARFPQFIQQVKAEGAQPTVVVRLATFYQLNQIRVVFRFIFTIPLLIIAADDPLYLGPLKINWVVGTDLLLMLGAFGCIVSSGITLFVFFPRSIAQESGYTIQEKVPMEPATTPSIPTPPMHQYQQHYYRYHPHQTPSKSEFDNFSSRHVHSTPISRSRSRYSYSIETVSNHLFPSHDSDSVSAHIRPQSNISCVRTKTRSMPPRRASMDDDANDARLRTILRRHSDGANFCERYTKATNATHFIQAITLADLYRPPALLHPYLLNFTSPIDLLDDNHDHFNSTNSPIQPS